MQTKSWFFVFFMFTAFNVLAQFSLFYHPARQKIAGWFNSSPQKVLSVVYGDLLDDGSSVKVVKFQSLEGVVLEFYAESPEGLRDLKSRVILPNAKDGFFTYRGEAVQLAVADLDGDGKMELLSPTFDDNMAAHLNPYHYSKSQSAFVPFFLSGGF